MAREREGYREQLEELIRHFGDVGMVTQPQVVAYTGRGEKWVRRRLGVGRQGVTLPVLARRLLELCDG
jgi:hypothetical protein